MNMKNTLLVLTALIVGSSSLFAQEVLNQNETIEKSDFDSVYVMKRTMSLGLVGGYSLDFHSATDMKLPEVPSCCPGYSGGTGGGFILGLSFGLPLGDDLNLLTRLTYHGSGVTMTTSEPTTVRIDNEAVPTTITHELQPTVNFISLEPAVEFMLGDLGLVGGVRLGTLLGATYDQREILADNIPYDFAGGTGVRNETSGDISGTSSFQFGLLLGARYHLPMNSDKTLELVPEIQFAPLFTSVLADQTWGVSSLRFMIGFDYHFTERSQTATPLAPN